MDDIVRYQLPEKGDGSVTLRRLSRLTGISRGSWGRGGRIFNKEIDKMLAEYDFDGGCDPVPSDIAKAVITYYYSKGIMTEQGCDYVGLPYNPIQKKKKKGNPEAKIQLRLLKELGGQTEVICKTGRIDLLTKTEVVEVKKVEEWKSAVGQALIYQLEFPCHSPRIHLYGKCSNEYKWMIMSFVKQLNVAVSFEDGVPSLIDNLCDFLESFPLVED